jgi:hypothetical protein
MFGCLRRLGCLVIILAAAFAAWFWYARVPSSATTRGSASGGATAASVVWEPLSQANAERGRIAVQSLSQRAGPVFANLTPSEAASYIFLVAAKQLPPSARNVEASAVDNRLRVRAEVLTRDFGGPSVLGPLASLLGDRDTVQFGGSIHVIRPGTGEFVVEEMRFGQAPIPSLLIPRLISRFRKKNVEGVSDRGLPMKMPDYISDVRIQNGKITLYKSVQ